MAKASKNDTSIILPASLLLLALVVAFGLAWLYLKNANKVRPDVAYSSFGPVVVRAEEYSIAASFALQTSPADVSWIEQHHKELDILLRQALTGADPARIRSPNGLQALQSALKETGNTALKTQKIQQVLFTDFIIQSN